MRPMQRESPAPPPRVAQHPAAGLFRPPPQGRVFINAAYMSPKPIAALEAMGRVLERMACPDFGVPEFFEPGERVRALLARVVGGDPSQFSLTGAASYGFATLAWNLRTGAGSLVGERRTILGLDGQFPSNVQTWRRLEADGFRLRLLEGGPGGTERLLEALDGDVAAVAFAPLSWIDGRRVDVARICAAAREEGALTVLDVTQSAGVDAPLGGEVAVDLVVGAGYKWLLGPYGTGFLRLTPELQERLEPLEANWKNFEGSQDFNRLTEYAESYTSPAAKFDHGESSAFVRMAGWEKGLEALCELGPGEVARHGRAFLAALREELDPEGFEVAEDDPAAQACHLFRVAPRDPGRFDALSEALDARGVSVSRRNGGWRLSPHVYNGPEDVAAFVGALADG